MTVVTGPCEPWTPIWNCDLSAASGAVTGAAIQAATEVLYALSGRQFDSCQLTIRPCRRTCWDTAWWGGLGNWWDAGQWPRPLFFQGVWYNITCGMCSGECSCTFISEVILPAPVTSVVTVKVDGVTLTAGTDYRLDESRKLVRLGGSSWPICNDLNLADSQIGTWSVTIETGLPVPTLGQIAVGELACQFIKALDDAEDCMLPKPVQQLVRQGITMTFLDPNEVFAAGRVGLYFSDLFITTVNPNGLQQPSVVYNVDGPGYRIVG